MWTWLLLLVPLSIVLEHFLHAGPLWVFVTSAAAIVPVSEWMRRGTEQLANRTGPSLGGLINISFGSVTEFTLALFVLINGQIAVAKAQITGSIICTGLFGLGVAILAGSIGRDRLTFNPKRAGLIASLLVLCVVALLIPALFDYTERGILHAPDPSLLDEHLSLGVAVVLLLVYAANLIYTLVTHRDIFAAGEEAGEEATWPAWKALAILLAGTVASAVESELISGALEATAGKLGLTPFFLGIIVLATIGNSADLFAAAYFGRRGNMGMVMSLSVGSTIQIALVVGPLLVIASWLIGHPMNLVFSNPLELIAIVAVAFTVNAIAADGEATWFEGLLLIAVYALLGLAFFFVTP